MWAQPTHTLICLLRCVFLKNISEYALDHLIQSIITIHRVYKHKSQSKNKKLILKRTVHFFLWILNRDLRVPGRGGWCFTARTAWLGGSLSSLNRPGPLQTALRSSACQRSKADPAEPLWLWLTACQEAEENGKSRASKRLLSLSLLVNI